MKEVTLEIEDIRNKIPPQVNDFLKDVAENNKDCLVYVGGGYLRDLYCGLRPKDLDIFLCPSHSWNGVEYIPEGCMVNYRKGTDDIQIQGDMKQRGLQRLTGLFAPKLGYVRDVQYIIYNKTMSIVDVASDFDMGICQIAYNPLSREMYYTGNFVNGHKNKVIECFHSYDEDRTIARYERMERKFPDYKVVGKPEPKVEETLTPELLGIRPSLTSGFTPKRNHAGSV